MQHTDLYVLFILGTLAVGIIVAGLIRNSYVLSNQMELARRARLRKVKQQTSKQPVSHKKNFLALTGSKPSPVTARQLQAVKTPWGWPQHGAYAKQSTGQVEKSHSLRHFTNRLIGSKKTIEDQEYLKKRNASIRALLEDRYGRASRMQEMPYRKVKAPLLRDPNAPFDQLDGLPSSKAGQVVSKLRTQPRSARDMKASASKLGSSPEEKYIKTPWGW